MKRSHTLCPECMKKKLLDEGNKGMYCDECGTRFIKVAENTVHYQ